MDDIYALTELYDEQHRGFAEDFPMYRKLAAEYGDPVLELGVGNARVALHLAAEGHRVYGIDLSGDMIDFSRRKAARQGVAIVLETGDMRDFDLRVSEPGGFGLVTLPFNTICHLLYEEDLRACLGCVKRQLRPRGVFARSLFVPDPAYLYRDPEALYPVENFYSESLRMNVEIHERNRYNPLTQINAISWFFSIGDEVIERSFDLRMYYPEEFRSLIRHAGFDIVEEWSGYERRFTGHDARTRNLPADTLVQTMVCMPR